MVFFLLHKNNCHSVNSGLPTRLSSQDRVAFDFRGTHKRTGVVTLKTVDLKDNVK